MAPNRQVNHPGPIVKIRTKTLEILPKNLFFPNSHKIYIFLSMFRTSRQDGQICILAVFAHGGTADPQVISCLSFGDVFAIGSSLQRLANRSTTHGKDIRQVHGFTDEAEKLGFASVFLGIVEVTGLLNDALLALRAKCGRKAAAPTNDEVDAVALNRLPHGASHEVIGTEQPTNANTVSPRNALLVMRETAIWVEKGIICANPTTTNQVWLSEHMICHEYA